MTTTEPHRISDLAARAALHAANYIPAALDDGEDSEDVAAAIVGTDAANLRRWHQAIPQRFHRATLDFYPESIRADLNGWATNPQGRNLVLFGPVGVGKTGAAVAACRFACSHRLSVKFASTVDLLAWLRPGGPDGVLDDMVDVDRLIVDDLGAEKRSEWTDEQMYRLLNSRWLEERPTVVTSNLTPEALEVHVGPRLFSRIVGSDAVCLRLTGPDRRRNPR